VIVEADLVDTAKPGDRVSIVGIYKAIAPRGSGTVTANFRTVVVANNVRHLNRDISTTSFTGGKADAQTYGQTDSTGRIPNTAGDAVVKAALSVHCCQASHRPALTCQRSCAH
jgi:hypothetical protein